MRLAMCLGGACVVACVQLACAADLAIKAPASRGIATYRSTQAVNLSTPSLQLMCIQIRRPTSVL
jgi:hypothetical protein